MNEQIQAMKDKIATMNDQEIKAALYDNQIANEEIGKRYTAERTTIAGERKLLLDALNNKDNND